MKPTRYWLNLLGLAALAVSLGVLVLTSFISSLWAESILRPARIAASGDLLRERGIPYQEVELTAKDGILLSAWYTPPQNGAVILIAHGYNDNRPETLHAMFAEHGYGALSWDFRAHGESGGDISTLGYFERLDVEAALEFALAQEGVEHVGAWGGSMGGATVILSAAEHPEIEAVVADSAFPSLEDVLRLNAPSRFLQPFVLFWGEWHSSAEVDDVNPEAAIGRISPGAVFIIDGWEGAAVALNSPYRLYDAANEPKEIWVEDGVPHLGMYARDPRRYEEKVVEFFNEFLLPHSP
ncbi:MAG: hypothetical protein DPW18_08120 [Chloroflexi bacterium]|nr:hypothetical protein [Chloroflexota bacterium]MDL1942829.1 alpha/beta hydrolase [Chloroflexi bacterium CFX2]